MVSYLFCNGFNGETYSLCALYAKPEGICNKDLQFDPPQAPATWVAAMSPTESV